MAPDRVGVLLSGGWVLLSPIGVGYCDRALDVAVRFQRRDGLPSPAEVRELVALLTKAARSSALPETEARAALVSLLASAAYPSALPMAEQSGAAAESRSSRPLLEVGWGSTSAALPLTTGSVAELLGMSDRGVRGLCSRGALHGEKIAGRWLIALPDLEEYVRSRETRETGKADGRPEQGELKQAG
jgi:hypothetical protein